MPKGKYTDADVAAPAASTGYTDADVATNDSAVDFTAPVPDEGVYKMTDKSGAVKPISYSQVRAASSAGYRMMDPGDIKKYVADTAADPNINTMAKGSGTKVVGRNSAGQPILAPEDPNDQEGSGLSRFGSSAWNAISGAASGLYHGIVEGPQNPEEARIMASGPGNLQVERFVTGPMKQQANLALSDIRKAAAERRFWPRLGETSTATSHALAAATPGIGPWVNQASEQAGEQIGSGNYAGAAGTVAGNAALYLAPHVLGKAGKMLPRIGRGTVEALTSTGPRELKRMAQETVKTNADAVAKAAEKDAESAQKHLEKTQEAITETGQRETGYQAKVKATDEAAHAEHAQAAEKVHKENATALKAHQDAVKAVQEENAKKLQEHIAAVEDSSKSNASGKAIIDARQGLEKKIADESAELKRHQQEAETKAKAENDAAWDEWRKKVAGTEAPSDSIVGAIKQSKSVMDPDDVAEFRKVIHETKPNTSEMGEGEKLQHEVMAGQFPGKTWEQLSEPEKTHVQRVMESSGFDPDEIEQSLKAVGADRLHVWKTQLEYAVRKATRGNVRYAIGKVLDAVRETEDNLSEVADAGKELNKARKLHGPYKDTFVNSPNEPQTVVSKSYQETTPEIAKTEAGQRRLDMQGHYDPEIPKLSESISKAREKLAAMPSETAARGMMKTAPPPPELAPLPPAPELKPTPPLPPPATETVAQPERAEHPNRPATVEPERKTISPEDIHQTRAEAVRTAAEKRLREQGVRRAINALYYTAPTAVLSTLLGHPGYALAEVAMAPVILAGSHALASLFDRPDVVAWISKVTPDDLAAIGKLPPEEKAVFSENLTQMVAAAKAKGVPISPALTGFIGASAQTATTPKTAKQLRDEMEQRKPTTVPERPAAEAVPEPQSMARPYTHVFDEQRGMIVPV